MAEIPHFVPETQGNQNRACTGEISLTTGTTNQLEFHYSNMDGVPINLSNFTLKLVFWISQEQYESMLLTSNIILTRTLYIEDAYKGAASVLLSDQDTLTIAGLGKTIRWSIYMIDTDGVVFASQITNNGYPYGIVHLSHSDLPNTETILGISIAYP